MLFHHSPRGETPVTSQRGGDIPKCVRIIIEPFMVSSKNERVLSYIVYVIQNRTAITKVTLNFLPWHIPKSLLKLSFLNVLNDFRQNLQETPIASS